MLSAAWLRYHLLDVPLERDEGEYAYGGQLLLQGVPPYLQLFNMKLPGIYLAYASVMAMFGQTAHGIHLGLLFCNLASIVFVFLLARKVTDNFGGLCAAACFAILSVGQAVQGVFANAEHFVLVPALAGLVLIFNRQEERPVWRYPVAGLLLGLAVVVKQHGAVFLALGGLSLALEVLKGQAAKRKAGLFKLGFFCAGGITPYLLICLWLTMAGVFDRFWFWTMEYARAYTGQLSLAEAWDLLLFRSSALFANAPLVWLLAGVGLPALFLDQRLREWRLPILALVVFSFLAVCPGGYFRAHYFVLMLPAIAILAGISLSWLYLQGREKISRTAGSFLVILLIVLSLLVTLYKERDYLFSMTPEQVSSSTYWPNPFPESLVIADYIAKNSDPSATVAVIGSEPQIPFYAKRKSATGYIYMYPLMERHDFALKMQEELIQEVEAAAPEFLVFVSIPYSWLRNQDSPSLIFQWFQGYKDQYSRVGLVQLFENGTSYSWEPRVKWPPTTPYWIEILRKKDRAGIGLQQR